MDRQYITKTMIYKTLRIKLTKDRTTRFSLGAPERKVVPVMLKQNYTRVKVLQININNHVFKENIDYNTDVEDDFFMYNIAYYFKKYQCIG